MNAVFLLREDTVTHIWTVEMEYSVWDSVFYRISVLHFFGGGGN